MKIAQLATKTQAILPLLRCPHCGQAFSVRDQQSLVCGNSHCYDLSSKGYVNLAPGHNQAQDKYDASLFASRRVLLERGFYGPVVEAIQSMIGQHFAADDAFSLLDAGCGEGFYARRLAARFPMATVLGLDLSRAAIAAAASQPGPCHFLVGNLACLPVQDHCLQVLLNILTPADYSEFARVLAPQGFLIKVIPGNQYLQQIRQSIAPHLQDSDYDNQQVLFHLTNHTSVLQQQTLLQTLPVTPEEAALFLRMTPMTFGLPDEALEAISFSEITLHLEVLLCRL